MEVLGQAGMDTQKILGSIGGTLTLASAGTLDLAEAADIASNALNAFKLPAEKMNHVADVLAAVANKTNSDVRGLGLAFSYAAPAASTLGMSIEELSAVIGIMSNVGIKGRKGRNNDSTGAVKIS